MLRPLTRTVRRGRGQGREELGRPATACGVTIGGKQAGGSRIGSTVANRPAFRLEHTAGSTRCGVESAEVSETPYPLRRGRTSCRRRRRLRWTEISRLWLRLQLREFDARVELGAHPRRRSEAPIG